jgi:hypothetical protein
MTTEITKEQAAQEGPMPDLSVVADQLVAGHAFGQNLRRGQMKSPPTSRPVGDSPSRSANWPRQFECDAEETPALHAPRSARASGPLGFIANSWGPWPPAAAR